MSPQHSFWSHGRTGNRFALSLKLFLIALLSLMAASCGVKNELTKPDGNTTPKNQPDPSRPPQPIGR